MKFNIPNYNHSIIKVIGVWRRRRQRSRPHVPPGHRRVDFAICNTDAQAMKQVLSKKKRSRWVQALPMVGGADPKA